MILLIPFLVLNSVLFTCGQYGYPFPAYPNPIIQGPYPLPIPPYGQIPSYYPPVQNGPSVPNSPSIPTCKSDKPPRLDFGDCEQLQPKEEDKKMKESKMKECFTAVGVSENSTLEELSPSLQASVNECLLRKRELLNDAGKFQFDKALEKLKEKKLPEEKQKKVEEAHVECKISAESSSSVTGPLAVVQAYFRCMDFHIAMVCNVKEYNPNLPPGTINPPISPSATGVEILSQAI